MAKLAWQIHLQVSVGRRLIPSYPGVDHRAAWLDGIEQGCYEGVVTATRLFKALKIDINHVAQLRRTIPLFDLVIQKIAKAPSSLPNAEVE